MTVDLSSFGPWREDICHECETLHLCVGPPEGPVKCKACWLGEPLPVTRRRRRQSEALFDDGAYRRGNRIR